MQTSSTMLPLLTEYNNYPENLIDTHHFQHELKAYQAKLSSAASLFHGSKRNVRILDLEGKKRKCLYDMVNTRWGF